MRKLLPKEIDVATWCLRAGDFLEETTPHQLLQWNLSIKDTLNKGHLSNEDTVCSPNHIELCTNLPLNY